ncbi:MAG: outer membrane beta-barrel protein [Lacibacter sp.]
MKMIFVSAALLMGFTVMAQDTTKKGNLVLSGSVDAYYRFNFANAKDSGRINNLTSFTKSQNSFELGMASVKADYSIGKAGAVLDLGFGRRAEEFSYNDAGTLAAIKQAYVTYAPTDKVKFTMGKWGTHVGYEMLDAYLNRNYSMSYMFSSGPFFHTGIKADFAISKNFAFMAGISNPTDYTTASFEKKFFIGQIHLNTTDGKLGGYLNYVGGKDNSDNSINQIDAVITGAISGKFSVGYNGTIKSVKPASGSGSSWYGSALYLNFDPCSSFGLTARGEYLGDKDGVAGFGTNIFDATLSANIKIGNLTIIPELRLDASKDALFYTNSDKLLPTAKNTGSFILAATYHF